MSKEVTTRWVCDRCGRDEIAGGPMDYMPEGWCHTMVGDDLCGSCRTD